MMLRSIAALGALPLLLSLAPACSTTPDDELAGETSADSALDGKADGAVDGAYTYFEIRTDTRKCLSPVCGGFFLARLNRTSTVCANGHGATSCYTPTLDWSEAGLAEDTQGALTGAAFEGATHPGVRAIVRGRFASQTYPGYGNLGRFVVTEAWVAEGDTISDGVFARIKDNGVRCIAAPCPSLTEKGLNTSRWANIVDVDWEPAALSQTQLDALFGDLSTAHGLIVAGDREYAKINGQSAKLRTATAVYRQLAD